MVVRGGRQGRGKSVQQRRALSVLIGGRSACYLLDGAEGGEHVQKEAVLRANPRCGRTHQGKAVGVSECQTPPSHVSNAIHRQ
jgi:hypothetical protein